MDVEFEASRGWDIPGLTQGWSVWNTAFCQALDVLTWGDLSHSSSSPDSISGVQRGGLNVDPVATPSPYGWEEGGLAGKGPWGDSVVGAQTPQSDWESSLSIRSPSQPLTLKDLLPLCSVGPLFLPHRVGLGIKEDACDVAGPW